MHSVSSESGQIKTKSENKAFQGSFLTRLIVTILGLFGESKSVLFLPVFARLLVFEFYYGYELYFFSRLLWNWERMMGIGQVKSVTGSLFLLRFSQVLFVYF